MTALDGIAMASGSSLKPLSTADAWRQFQGLFMKDLVREMRQSAGGDEGMFGSGPESGVMEDWYDQYLSEHLAASTRFLPGAAGRTATATPASNAPVQP
jgi:hypothetical protein